MALPMHHVDAVTDLSICIVNWNTRELTTQCLHSIYHTDQRVSFEVIIVDNDSSDESPEAIARHYPQARLIRNTENRGFGRANNQALRVSRGRYCLLLNSDTLLLDGALDALIEFMDTHPDTAVTTGKVFKNTALDEVLISFVQTFPTPRVLFLNDLVSLTGLKRLFPTSRLIKRWQWTGWNPEQEQEVANVTGACMCVRQSAIEMVGLMDELFFMYMEETDWCYRFQQAGWKIYYTPTASIVHFCEGSSQMRNDRDQLYYQSICYFFQKHYGKPSRLLYQLQELMLLRWLRRLHRFWHRHRFHPGLRGRMT